MLNRVTLAGRLGRAPNVISTKTGTIVVLSIATDERYKDKSGELKKITDWHNVVLFGSLAQLAAKMLQKGRMVYIEGKLKHEKYTDVNNIEKNVSKVVATFFKLIDNTKNNNSSQQELKKYDNNDFNSADYEKDDDYFDDDDFNF